MADQHTDRRRKIEKNNGMWGEKVKKRGEQKKMKREDREWGKKMGVKEREEKIAVVINIVIELS